MPVVFGSDVVGVVLEAAADFIRVDFTTDSRAMHRKLVEMVDKQTLFPKVLGQQVIIGERKGGRCV